jgi:hypothetical protein
METQTCNGGIAAGIAADAAATARRRLRLLRTRPYGAPRSGGQRRKT